MDTYYSVEITADRKIAEARRAAVQDRLAAVAVQVRGEAGQGARSRLAGLLRALGTTPRHDRPPQRPRGRRAGGVCVADTVHSPPAS